MKNVSDKLIMIPYADKSNANTGVNVSNDQNRRDVYFQNCCVSACSAKWNNRDCDVAVVCNVEIPEKYAQFLKKWDIRIIHVPFDTFVFDDNYKWSLAFYKLCALYHIAREYEYRYLAYLDSDVFVQSSFSPIWAECDQNILLYDFCHGLQVEDYCSFLEEVELFWGTKQMITHYGGEFFAATRIDALYFSQVCMNTYLEMEERGFNTTKGDEFILSVAASEMKSKIKNAGPYIYRYWTGTFRLVSTCHIYNPVTVLHIPAEKENGMMRIYRYIHRNERIPNANTVYKLLHLEKPSIKVRVSMFIQKQLLYRKKGR